MYSPNQIDPAVSFRNSQGQQVRGTIITLQRRALVMEIYNPYSIVQVSEVLSELAIKMGTRQAYLGKAVVISLVNTGLTAVVSLTLIDEWRELSEVADTPASVGEEARTFVQEWQERFRIHRDYQIVVNEMRAFLAEVSRWVEQVDLSKTLPREDNKLRMDVFQELAEPIMLKLKGYMDGLESEAGKVEAELAPAHRTFAQAALHPLLLRAPFIYRTYTKPLGYAGDYEMVNQILSDPREGPNTYFQIVNAAFLRTDVAEAHRNRIDILVQYLSDLAAQAKAAGRTFKVLNVGCGPAVEIQRFIQQHPEPSLLAFELVDFSEETLDYTREQMRRAMDRARKTVNVDFVHESVHQLLKRRITADSPQAGDCDAVYCAGLFDYLSNKVCQRLLAYFASRTRQGGAILATNVHSNNPMRFVMEHVLEWYLVYRDEPLMAELLPEGSHDARVYTDVTGVNVFAQASVAGLAKSAA
ncbi:MAG: class I SAM-dependent methyltransferase [Ralstonia sp.]|uniref:Class I SAM-dependent methyltransferase n=2 Tax=Ralstonia pickettii TaxID=329 RepID=A0A2P4RE95_RALPI|nr:MULTISPECIES: class I SAM-dependent methyltransferase PhcB [Ralstonia]MBA4201001.1 class I SAM-dependent methyltransferase [Ralstonia sp.]MBA4233257.1 class I SAM-dependent methyltransferase [Ralstonia sp.]MBA4236910.1 class I SAM-dependent methyltransferase [Ralstonia sp.]MBA4278368.1 class I SAM-dependent methyltransferase [Ralstonia sp.]MBA4294408.1 class I SAM-dependent methyltransferase [Ralstonia sp.]